ncbi:hypothetical protein GCM10023198_32560 [Promicromonospora umidemergens]|uniref:Uncharacterized protein n=1 Tax=Promicromonospora umidemergens TaxID=629679 RepID=A0ABP8XH78_9MICO
MGLSGSVAARIAPVVRRAHTGGWDANPGRGHDVGQLKPPTTAQSLTSAGQWAAAHVTFGVVLCGA